MCQNYQRPTPHATRATTWFFSPCVSFVDGQPVHVHMRACNSSIGLHVFSYLRSTCLCQSCWVRCSTFYFLVILLLLLTAPSVKFSDNSKNHLQRKYHICSPIVTEQLKLSYNTTWNEKNLIVILVAIKKSYLQLQLQLTKLSCDSSCN